MDLDETDENATKYKEIWIYLGITEIFTTLIYTQLIFRQVPSLDTYSMIIFIVFALAIYQIPWETFGLKVKPWQKASTAIPMLMTLITWENISFISLIMVAFFYIQTAIRQKNIRWTYFSVLLIDYAIGRWLLENQINEILWYAILVGLFFIYIAQIDPLLKNPPRNKQRHFCRLLGSGIICLFAVFFHQQTPLIPAVICLVFLITGLATQIRAFLWMGTINFVLTVSYQSLVLMFNYSFLKWIIGIISGITLIAIAANFEQNKEKFNQVLQNYLAQLQQWE